jgi:hypothetical protein
MEQDIIPVKYRAWGYRILTALAALSLTFGWASERTVGVILQVAGIFGFAVASAHTPTKTEG